LPEEGAAEIGQAFKLFAAWGPRADDARACAARLARMLEELAKAHPAFARWNEQGRRPTQWNRPFCAMLPRIDELTAIFERKPQPRVHGRDRGYSASAWNGLNNSYGLWFMILCGDGNNPSSMYFPNSVSMEMSARDAENADLTSAETMRAVLLAVVAGWDPAWAEVTDWRYKNALKNPEGRPGPPFRSGWMAYLSAPYAQRISPPPEAIVEPVPGGGLLLLSTREPFDAENPAHVAAADAIQLALEPIQGMVGQGDGQ
jgi:hypothetical protein